MAIAVATFLLALALIASERIHRTKVALAGAAIVVLFVGEFDQEKAIEAVDFNTIGLLADALDIDPIPLIVIEVIASNIGGTATLIGDPPNIIIAGSTGLSFNEFIVNLAPIVAVVFFGVIPLLYRWYRPYFQVEEKDRRYVMDLDASASIRDA